MSRKLVASLGCLAALAIAAGAQARDFRFFDGSDSVYYQRDDRVLERVVEPQFHLTRAQSAFVDGHHGFAAENLDKAAVGISYFEQRATGEQRRQLAIASRALHKLAHRVRMGQVAEATELDRAVTDARRVLSGVPAAPPMGPAPAAPTSTES
jgi:hypothetical protein